MKFYDELKAAMEAIKQWLVKIMKGKLVNLLKAVKCFCNEFGFIAAILKGALVKGSKRP